MNPILKLLKNAFARKQETGDIHGVQLEAARSCLASGDNSRAYHLAQALLESSPGDVDALQLMGLAAMALGNTDIAYECLDRSVKLRPQDPAFHNNLGSLYSLLGRSVEARACYREALKLNPGMPSARNNLIFAVIMLADEPPEAICREHVEWAAIHAEPLKPAIIDHRNSKDQDRQIRVGYLSADFRLHALTIFMDPVFEYRDRKKFAAFCYYNNKVVDEMTLKIRERVDGFRDITNLDDAAVADLIRDDGIDILVDLSGHLRGNRLLVFARKPAPVQITYLAYPGTTGMSVMDYRITDSWCDPPGEHDSHYCEELIRLPGCMWCFNPPQGMPEVAPLPAQKSGGITFASTNSIAKVSDEMLELWSRIVLSVPASRIVFATVPPKGRERVLSVLAGNGVGMERVAFFDRLPRDQFWAMYDQIDILLDTNPCNGGTTTCEALWLGVPVVSLRGQVFQSRAGFSILNAVGLPDLVAQTREEYHDKAVRLASDLPALSALRSRLREQMRCSSLVDGKGFTREIERLYQEVWRRWCKKH